MRVLVLLSLISILAACASPAPAPTSVSIATTASASAPTIAISATREPRPAKTRVAHTHAAEASQSNASSSPSTTNETPKALAETTLVASPTTTRNQAITFSVGPDEALSYPSNLTGLPDEHSTIIPPAPGSNSYLVFAAGKVTGEELGTVVLTTDLRTFAFAAGYKSPVSFPNCKSSYDPEFDLNYAAAGSVVQDPTRSPGNLMMIYEAENHCPGRVWQNPFYATIGFARSSDNGKTWQKPVDSELGGTDRYAILRRSTPESKTAEPTPTNIGDAIPSAFVDGNYLYVTYLSSGPGDDALIRVARAPLGGSGPLSFYKWYQGAFTESGIGGLDSGVLPSLGCGRTQGGCSL